MRKLITCPKCGGKGCEKCDHGWIVIWEKEPKSLCKDRFDFAIEEFLLELEKNISC